ncbi:MAG TPA: type I polyketide synthase, partial [Polyangiaceae bacterium]
MTSDNDIAVVGMALRVPGAANPREFWRNVRDGTECIRRFSDEELMAAGERADLVRRPNYVKAGAPLDRMEFFDSEFFGFSPKEAAILDPQHRQFFECAWEALEDAAHPPESFKGRVGVFAGCGMGSYFYFNLCTNPDLVGSVGMFLLRHTGNDKDFLATRASYLFDLRGPSVNVQTACSTSLVAVHLACQSLLGGECDMALAGGVTIELPHRRGYLYHEREILSPDGKCRAFDARAEGTVFGSGAGIVVLRRFQDALDDGDHIYAVIKGTAVNNDGSTKAGYLAPSVEGQAAAIAEALAVANVTADTVDYVECHGTGTYLGDPIEIAALTQAFRETTDARGYCKVGSVKTNIGHLDTAAGVASLIKVCLALDNGQIPPSLNFEAPNPMIDFASSPFGVANALQPWPRRATPRRATVNSLGVGGTNAHAVVEEAPQAPAPAPSARAFHYLALSARNRAALDAQSDALARYLEEHPEVPLADVSYTLLEGRRRFDQRRVLACATREEAVELLRSRDARRVFTHTTLGERANVVFMFPGGGAQYPNMARGLFESEPLFRELVQRGLAHLEKLVGYRPAVHLFPEADSVESAARELLRPSVQLPLIFIVEYALAKLWMQRGITPKAMVGHSLGEYAAACLSEVMTFEEAIGLVLLRGQLFETVPAGGMLSVTASAESLAPLLGGDLDLACINSTDLTVISGPNGGLERLERQLVERGIDFQRIPIHIAAHSRMLESILEPFRAHLLGLRLQKPKIPFVSNRSGTWITDAEATSADYWVNHLRHTVRFAECMATLATDESRIFLEVGPGRALGSLAKQVAQVKPQSVLPTLRHQNEAVDDPIFFATVEGRLWALGLPHDPALLWPGEARRRLSLPTYPFQGQSYWIPPGNLATAAAADEGPPMKERELLRWFFRPRFRERDVEPREATKQTWLVFVDTAGVGAGLVKRLRDRGHEVIAVAEGDAFYKLSDNEYRLSPEQGREGYDALVRELLASGKVPHQVVHLWLLTDREVFRSGSSFFHRNLEQGFFSLLFLAQALGGHDYPKPLHVTVAMNGVLRVREEAVTAPSKAAVLGPAGVIPRELEGVTCRVIDVHLPVQTAGSGMFSLAPLQAARQAALRALGGTNGFSSHESAESAVEAAVDVLDRELEGAPGNQVVAVRGDRRFVLGYERSLPETPGIGFRERGVYLITGGFGGIGFTVARHLASKYRARLVLVGRTPLPRREEFGDWLERRPNDPLTARIRQVRELESLGAEVFAPAADVTHVERVREAVKEAEERFGTIHGVLHAAGTLRDAPMLGKQLADVEAVFAPKVYGTLVLDEVLRDRELDFMVLFSSTSAAIAPPGQADYVAANAFLNTFAESAAARGKRVIALAWGIWRDVGMAADADRRLSNPEADVRSETIQRPMLTNLSRLGTEGFRFEGIWSTRTHWMLDEHRTANGEALLPGTGYLELIREAVAEIAPPSPFEIADLFFFRPLQVPDGQEKRVRVTLKPDDRGYEVEVLSLAQESNGTKSWERHAQAQVSLVRLDPPASVDIEGVLDRCARSRRSDESGGLRTSQEDHLKFGRRWRSITAMCHG